MRKVKIGMVVAGSLVCLVVAVLAVRLQHGGATIDPEAKMQGEDDWVEVPAAPVEVEPVPIAVSEAAREAGVAMTRSMLDKSVGNVPVTTLGPPEPILTVTQRPSEPKATEVPDAVVQESGPGTLSRAGFFIDGKLAYVLESKDGEHRLYATAAPGVNLNDYIHRQVDLAGPIVYRGDLRTNYISVTAVTPVADQEAVAQANPPTGNPEETGPEPPLSSEPSPTTGAPAHEDKPHVLGGVRDRLRRALTNMLRQEAEASHAATQPSQPEQIGMPTPVDEEPAPASAPPSSAADKPTSASRPSTSPARQQHSHSPIDGPENGPVPPEPAEVPAEPAAPTAPVPQPTPENSTTPAAPPLQPVAPQSPPQQPPLPEPMQPVAPQLPSQPPSPPPPLPEPPQPAQPPLSPVPVPPMTEPNVPAQAADATLPFTGTHTGTLEDQSLVLPASVRDQLGHLEPHILFVMPGQDGCVSVYTAAGLHQLGCQRLPGTEEKIRLCRRLCFSKTERVTLDASGKITLPASVIQHAGLQEKVTIIGVLDHFEIWDAERWENYSNSKARPENSASRQPSIGVHDWWEYQHFTGFFH